MEDYGEKEGRGEEEVEAQTKEEVQSHHTDSGRERRADTKISGVVRRSWNFVAQECE